MDAGSLFVPLGGSNGTTNAVIFGVMLLAKRDADLNVRQENPSPELVHHDHDAPPWWHFKKKKHLYIDGFAPKGHRPLMQFLLVPSTSARDVSRLGGRLSSHRGVPGVARSAQLSLCDRSPAGGARRARL